MHVGDAGNALAANRLAVLDGAAEYAGNGSFAAVFGVDGFQGLTQEATLRLDAAAFAGGLNPWKFMAQGLQQAEHAVVVDGRTDQGGDHQVGTGILGQVSKNLFLGGYDVFQ